jgi:hypothetical protein
LKSFIAVKDIGSAFYWSRAFVSLKRGWGNASDNIGDERPIKGDDIAFMWADIHFKGQSYSV